MINLQSGLEKMVTFNKSAIVPLFVLSLFLVYFFSISDFSESHYHIIHALFIGSVAATLLLAGYFRIMSSFMMASVIYAGYFVINNLRYDYGEDYIFSAGYNIWSAMLLPDLLLAYFLFRKNNRHWSWFYIFLLAQTAFLEKIPESGILCDSSYFYEHVGMFNYPALNIAVLCLVVLFFYHIDQGKILSAAAFFVGAAVFMGIYFSDNLFAFSLFFWAATLILLLASAYYIYYIRSRDEDLDIKNCAAYCREADSKFPLKYSIAVLYIDEYARLLKRFGEHKMLLLKKMFLNQIAKADKDVLVYTYKEDAFILVFKNENASESFGRAENIRRMLAKSIFIFNENNHLQLTVSQCVSDKKRSDANPAAVLTRAETALQKACKFTRNITVKA